jgi:hypothetical protein
MARYNNLRDKTKKVITDLADAPNITDNETFQNVKKATE